MQVDRSTNKLFFYYNRFYHLATKALVALLLYNCITSLDSHPKNYGTAHIQVYKQTRVTCHTSRNFEDNSCCWLMQHEEYTACERLLMS